MNIITEIGRLTATPELKNTNTGKPVTTFTIAVDDGKDKTYFFNCVAWNGTAENICKYFTKGNKIGITGKLTSRKYEGKNGTQTATEIVVNSFDFIESKRTVDQSETREEYNELPDLPEEELPF